MSVPVGTFGLLFSLFLASLPIMVLIALIVIVKRLNRIIELLENRRL